MAATFREQQRELGTTVDGCVGDGLSIIKLPA